MRRLTQIALFTALAVFAGCGGDDTASGGAISEPSTSSTVGEGPPATGVYEPVSDVAPHAAIGQDIAALKAAMEPATKGQPVDWAAAAAIFEQGGASKKGDGSNRTLAGLVPKSGTVTFVRDALAGAGSSQGATDPVRRSGSTRGSPSSSPRR